MTAKREDLLRRPYPAADVQYNTNHKYLSSNLASICQLGNHIFEFASLYGLSKRLNRTPTFFIENGHHAKMLERGRTTMPGLVDKFLVINGSVPHSIKNASFHKTCCSYNNPMKLEFRNEEYLHLTGMFYQSWKYFPKMRDELLGYLNEEDHSDFGSLPRSDDKTHVTCVHARRGDFLEVGFYGADPDFIRNALIFMNHRESTQRSRKVVLFGDDVKFMKRVFTGSVLSSDEPKENSKFFVSQNSPTEDLVYSKLHCDVVLISAPHSTFGWWMGYFSKGDKVYYMDIKYTNDWVYEAGEINPKDFYLPHWTALKFQSSNNWTVVESL